MKLCVGIIISLLVGAASMFYFMPADSQSESDEPPAEATALLKDALTAIQSRDYATFGRITHLTDDFKVIILEHSRELLARDFKTNYTLDYISKIKISETEVRYIWKAVSQETDKEGIISLWVSENQIAYFKIE